MNTVLVLSRKSNCVEASFLAPRYFFPDMAPAEGWAWKPGKGWISGPGAFAILALPRGGVS